MNKSMFSFKGRANIKDYWFVQIGIPCIVFVPLGIIFSILQIEINGNALIEQSVILFLCIFSIVWFWMLVAVTIKRFHDRNKSGWWTLIGLIPYLGWLWMVIELGFLGGVDTNNRFVPVQV